MAAKGKVFHGIQVGHSEGAGWNYIFVYKDFHQIRSKAELAKVARGLEGAAKYMRKLAKQTGKLK